MAIVRMGAVLVGVLMLSAACGSTTATVPKSAVIPSAGASTPTAPITPSAGRLTGDADILTLLADRGIRAERLHEAQQPFLRVIGSRQRLQSGPLTSPIDIQVYAYAQPAEASADAARIQPDTTARWIEPSGAVQTISLAWSGPPHFYRREATLVLYVGGDPAALALLSDMLGPQFAGRE